MKLYHKYVRGVLTRKNIRDWIRNYHHGTTVIKVLRDHYWKETNNMNFEYSENVLVQDASADLMHKELPKNREELHDSWLLWEKRVTLCCRNSRCPIWRHTKAFCIVIAWWSIYTGLWMRFRQGCKGFSWYGIPGRCCWRLWEALCACIKEYGYCSSKAPVFWT